MSAPQPASNVDQEMDLKDIFTLFQRTFYKFLALCFKAVDFIFKFWWIILLLIIAGATFGYFTKGEPSYKSVVILKSNFNSQAYLYNAVKQFNDNLSEKDSVFIESYGLTVDETSIKGVEIEPIIDVVGLMNELESTDRTLSAVIKELEAKDDQELFASDRFYTNYKYHKLIVYLKNEDAKKDIEKILDFINNQPYAQKVKDENIKNMKDRIEGNESIIAQSNVIIESFTKNADISSRLTNERLAVYNSTNEIDFNGILTIKRDMVINIEYLRNQLIESSDTVVAVSNLQTSINDSLKNRKEIIYPIVFVFIFLLLAGVRYIYSSLRREVEAQNLLN